MCAIAEGSPSYPFFCSTWLLEAIFSRAWVTGKAKLALWSALPSPSAYRCTITNTLGNTHNIDMCKKNIADQMQWPRPLMLWYAVNVLMMRVSNSEVIAIIDVFDRWCSASHLIDYLMSDSFCECLFKTNLNKKICNRIHSLSSLKLARMHWSGLMRSPMEALRAFCRILWTELITSLVPDQP